MSGNSPIVTKKFTPSDGSLRMAAFSRCDKYRFILDICWDVNNERGIVYLMLNPSTATEERNDPTIERCMRRAKQLGYGQMCILNLFAYRATDPADLLQETEPVGFANNDFITETFRVRPGVDLICGWGEHGAHRGRAKEVCGMIDGVANMKCLAVNQSGHPRHPLYVGYDVQPRPFTPKF